MSNTHYVGAFFNHPSKKFTVSARRGDDTTMLQCIAYMDSIGMEFVLLATQLTVNDAKQLKSNIISSYKFAGYEKVMMNKEAILSHPMPPGGFAAIKW